MTQAPVETSGARRAALLLHAMTPVDRAWVLGALPPARREPLQRLLAELEDLGLPGDPILLRSIERPEAPRSAEAVLHALPESGWTRLGQLLESEPLGLFAQWLGLADWPWRLALLDTLEPGRRRRVETALALRTPTPPALRAALIDAVAGRVRDREPAANAQRRWPVSMRGAVR